MPNDEQKVVKTVDELKPGMVLSADLILEKRRTKLGREEIIINKLGAAKSILTEERIEKIKKNWHEAQESFEKTGNSFRMVIQVYKSMALPSNINPTFSDEELITFANKIELEGTPGEIGMDKIKKMISIGEDIQKRIESSIFIDCDMNSVIGKEDENVGSKADRKKARNNNINNRIRNVTIAAIAVAVEYNKTLDAKEQISIEDLIVTTMLYKIGAKYGTLPDELIPKKLESIEKNANHKNMGYEISENAFKEFIADMESVYAYNSVTNEYNVATVKNAILLYKENSKGTGPLKYKVTKKSYIAQILNLCDTYYELLENNTKSIHEVLNIMKAKTKDSEYSEELYKILVEKIPIYPRGSKLLLTNHHVVTVVAPNKEYPDRPRVRIISYVKGILKEGEIDLTNEMWKKISIKRFVNEGEDKEVNLEEIKNQELEILKIKYEKIIRSLSREDNELDFIMALFSLNTIDFDMIHKSLYALFENNKIGNNNHLLRQKIEELIKNKIEKIPFSKFEEIANNYPKDKLTYFLVEEKRAIDKNYTNRIKEKEYLASEKVKLISKEIAKESSNIKREEILNKAFAECITEEEKEKLLKLQVILFPKEKTVLEPDSKQRKS